MRDGVVRAKPGTYVVVLRSGSDRPVQIGRWGVLALRPGYYVYVGSALGPGGLLARVSRHCRGSRAKHWHVDYLRELTEPCAVWFRYSEARLEHDWARVLAGLPDTVPIKGFGCTDCRCEAHLFFAPGYPSFEVFSDSVEGPVSSSSCNAIV